MHDFQMCPQCLEEYENPLDRRYYSQTNSCPDCAIKLSLYNRNGEEITCSETAYIDKVVQLWQAGKIVAIKGIGGYLLTCDARQEASIRELRKKKHRSSKPFALMYPNLESLSDFWLSENEQQALSDISAPIVLLEKKKPNPLPDILAPGLEHLGVMIPCTPLYDLLLKKCNHPIVATSGNISNAPIVFRDEEALAGLSKIADYILTNNRDIIIPQDDSVLRFTFFKKEKIILRRSRGLSSYLYQCSIYRWSEQEYFSNWCDVKKFF